MGFLNKFAPQILSILRIVTGLQFLEHGTSKFFNFPYSATHHAIDILSRTGAAGTIECVAGALIILGLYSRIAAFIASGEMAFAYFLGHFPHGFFPLLNGGDPAISFCFIFLLLAAMGPGPIALNQK